MANTFHVLNGQDKQAMLKEWHSTGKAFSSASKTARRSARKVGKLALHDIRVQGRVLKDKVSHFAKERPLAALGGVLFVGAFLALLLKR